MSKFKKITHVFAAVLAGAAAFVLTPAGKALIGQYPALSAAAAGILAIAALYHNPTSQQAATSANAASSSVPAAARQQ